MTFKYCYLPKNWNVCTAKKQADVTKLSHGYRWHFEKPSKYIALKEILREKNINLDRTIVMLSTFAPIVCSDAGTGGGGQYFADQLTLFEPGRADYPQLLLLAPPMFFTFRHHCGICRYSQKIAKYWIISHF